MYKLIIVDDEPNTCNILSAFIDEEDIGFQVVETFCDGQKAWEYIQNEHVDFVITDIRMPHMDGLELANIIYLNKMPIIVVLLSGYSEFEYARQGILYGVRAYFLKPVDFNQLSKTLRDLKLWMDEDERFAYEDAKEETEVTDATIAFAEKYILEHFSERISREDVAAACYLNPSYFGRYFKQKTGYAFVDYLTNVRMQQALKLLAAGDVLDTVSTKVGYTSTRHFVRVFKEYYGITPREYRKLNL